VVPVNLAFEIKGGDDWKAGIVVTKALCNAMHETSHDVTPHFVLMGTESMIPDDLRDLKGNVLKIPIPERRSMRWAMEHATRRLVSLDVAMKRVLEYHAVDVLFGHVLLYRYGRVPTLSWIPDFQHIHLPKMFDEMGRSHRDRSYLRTAKLSDRIIVLSESVKNDFERFAPQYKHKVRLTKIVSSPPKSIYETSPVAFAASLNLPERFIYLPNQFWKHKNHELVFKVVRLLKERGLEIFVVCDGYPMDYRHPSYFADLITKLSVWNIRNQVAIIRSISQMQVFSLMRQAICVLNPSLFEGFGLTVSEAISVGKRVVLSDIPAHREQNPPKATFFDPNDCEDLAEKLSWIWHDATPGPDVDLEEQARRKLPERIHASAESFMSVISEVTQK
jgi:glycosyltransferase involved in cell wall biosynthesis